MLEDSLPFLNKNDEIVDLNLGHSQAKKWLIKRKKEKYFLKCVVNDNLNNSKIYNDINSKIKILPNVVNEHFISNKHYTLFEFISGESFDNLSVEQCRLLGSKVGDILRTMSNIKTDVPNINLNEIIEECLNDIEYFFNMRSNPFTHTKQDFIKYARESISSFENESISLTHGDIKPENIIVSDNNLYLVDTDNIINGYFAFNFQYTVQMIFDADIKRAGFMQNVIKSYYGNVPKYFKNNIKFMLIKKFFNRVKMFIENNDLNNEKLFIEEFSSLFANKEIF